MEENKKRPLSEEELEQVAGGGVYESDAGWECTYCWKLFPTKEEAEEHEKNCPKKGSRHKSGNNVIGRKPIIL